ncbi:MAG: AbrB/MazE/SpoVT family DNA-binding domain-containing protein [Nitrososphaeria archaeon]|nr:AbrB/MazE/SpoVT family DNA-binding domain-containing protein [Nitrososphaeria archaeon]
MAEEVVLKVTRKGQVTIPKTYRDILGIKEGDLVYVKLEDNMIVISKTGIPEPGQAIGEKRFKEIIDRLEEERRIWF